MRNLLVIPSIAIILGCGDGQPPIQVVKLPSGKQLKVLNVARMYFSQGPPALMLNYQTDLDSTETVAIENEVDEIWKTFRVDVEKANLTVGIIRANEIPKGFIITTGKAFGFVYSKGPDGQWSRKK